MTFNYNLDGNALLIVRLSSDKMDAEQIAACLTANGVKLISQAEVNAL